VARITFQKRQKEMKRLEKQRLKAERRAQKKLTKHVEGETDSSIQELIAPSEPESEIQPAEAETSN